MSPLLQSCAEGATTCDDSHGAPAFPGLLEVLELLGLVPVVLLVVIAVWILIRRARER